MVDVLVVGRVAVGEVDDRVAPHVLEEGRIAVLEQALEEDALAQAGLGDLDGVEAAALHRRVEDDRAPQDHVAAVGLDALDRAALRDRRRGQQLDQLVERLAREAEALHVDVRQVERASGPRSRGCGSCRRSRPGGVLALAHHSHPEGFATCLRSALICFALVFSPSRKASLTRTAPRGTDTASSSRRSAIRMICTLPPPMSIPKPSVEGERVGDREVAVARLLGAADHAHVEARPLADRVEQLVAVGRVADRAGGDRVDVLHPRRPQERREHRGGVNRAVHRLGLKHALLAHPRAYARALADLVGEAPPAPRLVLEDDEPERVRAHVDDGYAFHRVQGF